MKGTNRLKGLALCLAFTLGGACGDDLQEGSEGQVTCQSVCLVNLEVGVECHVGLGITKVQCGPDANIAAFNCSEGGGLPGDVVPHCQEDGGGDEAGSGTTMGSGASWDPLAFVELESTGTRVIDRAAFELILDDLSLLEADATVLRTKDDGTWFIAFAGELCEALGLERFDELAAVNGKDLSGLGAMPELYDLLQGQGTFELTIVRGEERVLQSYRLE